MTVIKESYLSKNIERSDLLPLSFLDMSPYTGSKRGIRFRIEKQTSEDGEKSLLCSCWRGPFAYGHTDSSEMTRRSFAFSEEGLSEIVSWLNTYAGGEAS